jgi:hypothetical protein
VRFRAFAEEGGYLDASDYPGGRECDSFDTLPTTDNILALDRDLGVGAVRVLRRNPEVAERNGWDLGISIEELYNMGHYAKNRIEIAEVPRSSITKDYQDIKDDDGITVLAKLYKRVYSTARNHGATHICGAVNVHTDHVKDALVAMKLAGRMGLATDMVAEPRFKDTPESSDVYFYPEVESSEDDYLDEFLRAGHKPRLPPFLHTVTLFGCKVCGPPAYYRNFRRYVLPVELELEKVPEPMKSYFEMPD